jgi:hypothetical protein
VDVKARAPLLILGLLTLQCHGYRSRPCDCRRRRNGCVGKSRTAKPGRCHTVSQAQAQWSLSELKQSTVIDRLRGAPHCGHGWLTQIQTRVSNPFKDSCTAVCRSSEGDFCEAETLYWFARQGSKFTPVPFHLFLTQYHIINDAYMFISDVMLELFRTFLNHQLSDIFKSPITTSLSVRSPHYMLRSIVPINTHTLSLSPQPHHPLPPPPPTTPPPNPARFKIGGEK